MPNLPDYERLKISKEQLTAAALMVSGQSSAEAAAAIGVKREIVEQWGRRRLFQQAMKLVNAIFDLEGRKMYDITRNLHTITAIRKKHPQIRHEVLDQISRVLPDIIDELLQMVKISPSGKKLSELRHEVPAMVSELVDMSAPSTPEAVERLCEIEGALPKLIDMLLSMAGTTSTPQKMAAMKMLREFYHELSECKDAPKSQQSVLVKVDNMGQKELMAGIEEMKQETSHVRVNRARWTKDGEGAHEQS